GAYSPAPVVTEAMLPEIRDRIILPVVRELKRRGVTYRGVLYAGLMVNDENSNPHGPVAKSGSSVNVVEFNARFGDPETEAVLPRLGGDFAKALLHAASGCLKDEDIVVKDECAATVIVSSGGYPGGYEKDKEITGLEDAGKEAIVFHCGTKVEDGRTLTSGGRVLSVTGVGSTLREAVDKAYAAIGKISFDKMFYRKDIAHRAFDR
ncbi:MAG: phosphoribosylamine--glycine ligase, partial [Kiritimatiellae bacterium]|nr:phosphoribosylamine--glycine ligase [Kiritimatiellia bacterium]